MDEKKIVIKVRTNCDFPTCILYSGIFCRGEFLQFSQLYSNCEKLTCEIFTRIRDHGQVCYGTLQVHEASGLPHSNGLLSWMLSKKTTEEANRCIKKQLEKPKSTKRGNYTKLPDMGSRTHCNSSL